MRYVHACIRRFQSIVYNSTSYPVSRVCKHKEHVSCCFKSFSNFYPLKVYFLGKQPLEEDLHCEGTPFKRVLPPRDVQIL